MSEPFFISQTDEISSPVEMSEWFEKQVEVSKSEGGTFHRATIHPTIKNLILLEGWKEWPADQGEPRFQIKAGQTSD